MPRKLKVDLNDSNAESKLLRQIYNDNFVAINSSIRILRSIGEKIDYNNKQELIILLPLIQKQVELLNNSNNIMLDIQQRWTKNI